MAETTATSSVPPSPTAAGVVGYDLSCVVCGYNVRGLLRTGACPECGAAVARAVEERKAAALPASAARVLASGLMLLELAAFVAILTLPIAVDFRRAPLTWTIRDIAVLGLLLFPLVSGWWGASLVLRRSAMPRRLPRRWHVVRWFAVACSTLTFLPILLTVALAMCGKAADALMMNVAYQISTAAVTAATSCTYLYLSRVAASAGFRATSWMAREFGAIVLGVTIWAYCTDGLPTPTAFGADRVVGSALPIAIEGAAEAGVRGRWLADAPVVAMGAASILAVFVLDQLRRSFSRYARAASRP